MKHHWSITRMPRVATTTNTTDTGLTGSTSLEILVNFCVMMVERVITYIFQKSSAL